MTGRTGVVLAGGYSRRFGPADKALAEVGGESLLVRVVDRVSTVVDEVIVSCRPVQVDVFEATLSSAAVDSVDKIVKDRFVGAGPLAGIESSFDVAAGKYTAVVACDMPFVEPAFVEKLFERIEGAAPVDAVVPEDEEGQLQPVQATYRTSVMRNVVASMFPGGGSVHEALDALEVVTVPADRLARWSVHNVNTRRDLLAAEWTDSRTRERKGNGRG